MPVAIGACRQAYLADLEDRIRECLRSATEPVPQKEIIRHVAAKRRAVIDTLNRMSDLGLLVQMGKGKKGPPYLYVGCDVVPHPTGSHGMWRRPWLKWWEFEQPGEIDCGDERNCEAADLLSARAE